MPDGDIVHSNLSWLYQKPYKCLCDIKSNSDECARVLIGAMLRDIKKKGAAPVVLAKRMGEKLRQAIDNGCRNWAALSEELDRLAQQASCLHYEKQLVLLACHGILHDFRYGQRMEDTSILPEVAVERYMQEVYKSNFEQRIPLTFKHHAGVDYTTVMEKVKALPPNLFPVIRKWAKQANVDEDVKKLRRPPRQKVKDIDMYGEDLRPSRQM